MPHRLDQSAYLSILPSSAWDRRAAICAVLISALFFIGAVPFVRVTFPPLPAFIASYHSSLTVIYVVTSILLFSQFAVLRSRAILALASGYLFTATVIAGYALTYRDLFAETGLFYPGPETTVWFYLIWHGGFPAFAVIYALMTPDRVNYRSKHSARTAVVRSILAVLSAAIVVLFILTAAEDRLPDLLINSSFTIAMTLAVSGIFGTCLTAIFLLLRRRPYSVLDVWLMVILCVWIFDISLSAVLNAARFDFGFYAGRLYGLFAALGALGILLAELSGIQLRLSYLMRQQAREAALKLEKYAERERLFSAAVRSSNDAIITKSLDGFITGWNESAERLFGYRSSEAIGQSIDLIVPEDRRAEVRQILNDVREGRTIENHETVRTSKDGRLIDISLSVSPVRSDTGEMIGAAKVARDITEQKISAEKFRLAVDASPNGLIMIDPEGRIILVNSEIERLFGFMRSELLGEKIDMLLPHELRERHASLRADYASHPSSRPMGGGTELMGQRRNGERFPLEIGLNPVTTRAGILVLAVVVDISARKKAERALRDSERMAQRILETALGGLIQFNSSLQLTDANRQAEMILGRPRTELISMSVLDVLFPTSGQTTVPPDLYRYLTGENKTSPGSRFEVSTVALHGRMVTLEISLTHYHRDGERHYNAFLRDLTEQRAAEAMSRQAQKMEAIGQLTGGVAHDFNNILTVITGAIEILAQGVEDRPQLAAIARLIDSAATRGADLTRHLLAFSRSQPLRPTVIDVNALVLEAAKLLRPTLGAQFNISLDLSASTRPALVDPSQLTTAILNLALNSRDASAAGSTITIRTGNASPADRDTLASLPDGDFIYVEVADEGHGMEAEILNRVFEPFFTTKDVGEGTGLGLSMVYGFAKQSNGHVQIESAPKRGTAVRIFLPVPGPDSESAVSTQPADASFPRGCETILIVEDDALVRAYVVMQIESLGYKTLTASDGLTVIRILQGPEQIDLLFTDVVLPGDMNGRQIADEASRIRPDLPVLFTSGYTEDPSIRDSLEEGEITLLEKPYRLSQLAHALRKSLATLSRRA